jgi:hypothetical protein
MQIGATILGTQASPARATREAGGRVVARPAVEEVVLREDASRAPYPPPAGSPTRRAQPAGMLYAMFEQMGGASTSVWKGMYVNLVV